MLLLKNSLKRIFIFSYQFEESKNLNEVKWRLMKNKFEVVGLTELNELIDYVKSYLAHFPDLALPQYIDSNNAIAARSLTVSPTMIAFLFLQCNDRGGVLVLFETEYSWYSYEKILHSMRAFNRNAGIRSKFIGVLLPNKGLFLTEIMLSEDECNHFNQS